MDVLRRRGRRGHHRLICGEGLARLYTLTDELARAEVDRLRDQTGNALTEAYVARVVEEFDAAIGLVPPAGWSFRPKPGAPVTMPNLMQRHTAVIVAKRKHAGNWSGTGAGKTVSAVLASRVIGAGIDGINLVFCPRNVFAGWEDAIRGCYPDSRVVTRQTDINHLDFGESNDQNLWMALGEVT